VRFQVSLQVETDLGEIWLYVAQEAGDGAIASRVVNSITDRFALLAKFPHMGKSREVDLGPNRRSFAVNNYVIFYRVRSGQVEILRVLHGRRDVHAILAGE
jgi:toxin ParE1/3/4